MTNKYLEKIAQTQQSSNTVQQPSMGRALVRGGAEGALLGMLGSGVGNTIDKTRAFNHAMKVSREHVHNSRMGYVTKHKFAPKGNFGGLLGSSGLIIGAVHGTKKSLANQADHINAGKAG